MRSSWRAACCRPLSMASERISKGSCICFITSFHTRFSISFSATTSGGVSSSVYHPWVSETRLKMSIMVVIPNTGMYTFLRRVNMWLRSLASSLPQAISLFAKPISACNFPESSRSAAAVSLSALAALASLVILGFLFAFFAFLASFLAHVSVLVAGANISSDSRLRM